MALSLVMATIVGASPVVVTDRIHTVGGAGPCCQTALACALEIIPICVDMCGRPLHRPDLDCVPRVVVFDLKSKKLMNCLQRVGIRGLNTHSAACGQLFEAVRNLRMFVFHHRNAGRHLVMDEHGNGEFKGSKHSREFLLIEVKSPSPSRWRCSTQLRGSLQLSE